jgi:hypothetical protein
MVGIRVPCRSLTFALRVMTAVGSDASDFASPVYREMGAMAQMTGTQRSSATRHECVLHTCRGRSRRRIVDRTERRAWMRTSLTISSPASPTHPVGVLPSKASWAVQLRCSGSAPSLRATTATTATVTAGSGGGGDGSISARPRPVRHDAARSHASTSKPATPTVAPVDTHARRTRRARPASVPPPAPHREASA